MFSLEGVAGVLGAHHDPAAIQRLGLSARVPPIDIKTVPAMHRAAANGDREALRGIRRNDPDAANELDEGGRTPLMFAAMTGQAKACNLLLCDLGAVVNARDDYGWTALVWAVVCGQVGAMKALLKRNADPNNVDDSGHSCVHWAVTPAGTDVLKEVLRVCGSDAVNQRDSSGCTPLHWCVACEHCAAHLELLLEPKVGANVGVADNNGNTPVHLAVTQGSVACLRALVAASANSPSLNQLNRDGFSALHIAVWQRDGEVFMVMLGTPGVDVNLLDIHGRTALHYAAIGGQPDRLRALLGVGALANVEDHEGRTPLQLAIDMVRGWSVRFVCFVSVLCVCVCVYERVDGLPCVFSFNSTPRHLLPCRVNRLVRRRYVRRWRGGREMQQGAHLVTEFELLPQRGF